MVIVDESYNDTEDETHNGKNGEYEQTSDETFSEEEDENVDEYEDYSHLFERLGFFDSRDEAYKRVQILGMAHNMYFAIRSTKHNRSYVYCNRYGVYTEYQTKEGTKPRNSSGSIKNNCQFQLIIRKDKYSDNWYVRTNPHRGVHNHALLVHKEGNRFASQLRPEQKVRIRNLSQSGATPAIIKHALDEDEKEKGGENYCTSKHIYNEVYKIKKGEMGDLAPLQFYLRLLKENNWISHHRPIGGTENIGDIFFAHPESVKIGCSFSQVLLIDATHSTNRYKLPLVQIIGFVPTGQNYHVAFAFLQNEKESTYTWMMEQLSMLFLHHDEPRIFVTDREYALMNAIRKVFPEAVNFLCRRHISVDINKRLVGYLGKGEREKEKEFREFWNPVVHAQTGDDYDMAVAQLEENWSDYPAFILYLHNTWLDPHHHRFVDCWTNEHMHFGALTTNRVESSHSQLKGELKTTNADFHTCWRVIDRVVENQIKKIKAEFVKSSTKIHPHTRDYEMFSRLRGIVSHKAIELLVRECRRNRNRDPDLCTCTIKASHGLPCHCYMMECINQAVPVDPVDIDIFWRTLHFGRRKTRETNRERASAHDLLDEAVENFKKHADDEEINRFAERVRRETNPEWNKYKEPLTPPKKGRPSKSIGSRFKSFFEKGKHKNEKEKDENGKDDKGKKKKNEKEKDEKGKDEPGKKNIEKGKKKNEREKGKGKFDDEENEFVSWVPQLIRPFVTGYHNVCGDGNCGFRVLSHWFYNGNEHQWVEMRLRLKQELEDHPTLYGQVLGDSYDDALRRICWYQPDVFAPEPYWMRNPESGIIAATHFGVIVNVYCEKQTKSWSWMCLPLRCDYDEESAEPNPPTVTWNFLLVGAHWIRINVRAGAPMPFLHYSWKNYCDPRVLCWEQKLGGRFVKIM